MLALIDWIIVGLFLSLSLYIGIKFKGKSSGSLTDFFLAGRNLPWYIAGISMVATTFAADTPLWVAEVIKQNGVSGNWLWWNMLIGGMLTTFFFAKLWRKANVLTELEFIELRYSGKTAKLFRNFKAFYLGVFFNCIVIGWVNAAMLKILMLFLNIDYQTAFIIISILLVFVAIYSSLSGLLGVAITDAVQFVLAMAGCIILSIIMLNSEEVGGMTGLQEKLPAWRFDFFPNIGDNVGSSIGTFGLTIGAFLSFVAVQWWASWYPGNEPGGGGYISQRMMSTKNEKNAVLATLFFQIAHYALRPWPWIIVGLCALVVYPELTQQNAGNGFVMAMRDYMPTGLRGLIFTAFLGAYMSTISTQLNWGASYLTNDLYKRQLEENKKEINQQKMVKVGRVFTVMIMIIALIITSFIETIDGAARFLIASSAGLGAVLILRWYWSRINIWSEISATLAPILGYSIAKFLIAPLFERTCNAGNPFIDNEGILLFTTAFTTIIWITVTFLTPKEEEATLKKFYLQVKPQGAWNSIREKLGMPKEKSQLPMLFFCWVSAVILTYSTLFFIGKLIFQEYFVAIVYFIVAVVFGILLRYLFIHSKIFND
ncbi:MAG: Na+:solute symporter [Flavobacteriales bacterium]|nr:Na+:solute symporter [Flavobacteriales bacterium]MCW8913226.1 Na+:solute symporter [Flavobacteriales bacterium]MCW8936802.1 Na+:solute symporter [Flavobacteriales bacterium]MCW8968642.1 Na+:solute symporter [Flavobacteriales bacterium]MCW8989168.1 Na+:solute symporter [Flavobacteriales bacterium]